MPKYRLKGGYIEAEAAILHYILSGPDERLRGAMVLKEDFEARYEPIPESEWETYAIAIKADEGNKTKVYATSCLARSNLEAFGIAYFKGRELFPYETHSEHQHAVSKVTPEDN